MKNLLNYSKFIFFTGHPAAQGETHTRAPETPRQQVDQNLSTLEQKQQAELREKEEAAKKLKDNKEKLHKAWMENSPHGKKEVPEDNPAYLALKNIPGINGKEAFALLSVVAKNFKLGGAAKANEIYRSCIAGKEFDIDNLRKYFTRDFGIGTLGFYYGTKKETKITKRRILSDKKTTVTKTGWWTIDADDKNDDEFSGEKSFLKAIQHIRKELMIQESAGPKGGFNDSSLNVAEEKAMAEDLKNVDAESRTASNEVFTKAVFEWLKANAKSAWTTLTPEIIGKFSYLFGEGCGKYQYRIYNEKVYCIRIPGQQIPAGKKEAGYFDIKDGKLDAKWNDMNPDDLKKNFIDNMTPVEIERELAAYKIESGSTLTADEKLKASVGLVSTLSGLPHVEYDNLDNGYIKKVKEGLVKKLKERKTPDDRINEIAEERCLELKKAILAKIEAFAALKAAVAEDSKLKLDIKVNDKDEVTVDFADMHKKNHYLQSLKTKTEDADLKGKLEARKTEFENKIKKKFGFFAPFILKFLKLDEGLADIASGNKSKAATRVGLVAGILGINVAAFSLLSKGVKQKDIDAIIPEGKNEHEFDKRVMLSENVTLKDKKIVIPKGKGIVAGGKFKVKIKKDDGSEQEVEIDKAQQPKKRFSLGLMGGGAAQEQEQHKDVEITIEKGTKLPKGTSIPDGAKIIKV